MKKYLPVNNILKKAAMKKFIYLLVLISATSNNYAQDCLKAGICLTEIPDCNNSNYSLIFEDNFNGSSLDLTKWDPITGVPRNFNFTQQKAWHLPENLEVSNGTLKITAKKLITPYTGTWVTDWSTTPPTTQTSTFDYTTGELWTKQDFFYGKYEILCRLPNGKGFWPAFWTFGGQRWNEIDVFDNLQGNDRFSCGPGYDFDGDGNAEGCRWGTNNIPDFSQWHIFTCIFDFDKIIWQIDGNTIRTLYRYSTVTGNFITCGDNIGIGTYFQERSFPVEDMHIIMNLAIRSGDAAPDVNTVFPNTYEIDYVRFYKKSEEDPCCFDCSPEVTCDGCLDHIVYDNINQLPTVTRAKNYIQAGNNVTVQSGQNVSFKAPTIELLPGFSTEPGATFEATAEECNLLNYSNVPIVFIGSNAIDNWEIVKCINPMYSIEAAGAIFYSFQVYTLTSELVYSIAGIPTSNHINLWDATNAAEAWYSAVLTLLNCSDSDVRNYNLLVSYGSCKMANTQSDSTNYSSKPTEIQELSDLDTALVKDIEVPTIYEDFLIYPNPTKNELYIFYSLNEKVPISIIIIDISGKEICREEGINSQKGANRKTIDSGSFANGTYILRIIATDKQIEKKFVIAN